MIQKTLHKINKTMFIVFDFQSIIFTILYFLININKSVGYISKKKDYIYVYANIVALKYWFENSLKINKILQIKLNQYFLLVLYCYYMIFYV